MSVSKKKRTKKTSAGINGARKHPLSEIAKALLGKGRVEGTHHVECKNSWKGVGDTLPNGPYNAAQAEENKRLYPHLFSQRGRR